MSKTAQDPPPFQPFRVHSTEQVYSSPWCGLRRDMVELAGGRLQEYHVFEVKPSTAVVPVLADGSIALLWQYRHPHQHTHWEVPAGRIDEGESPEEAAHRELLEETGLRTDNLEYVTEFFPTNGISSHHATIFIAHDCEQIADPTPEAAERFVLRIHSEEEVRRRLNAGGFADGFTALSLFYHFSRL